MRTSRFAFAALVALTVGALSSTALAEPTAAEKETARQALADGKRKLAAGDAPGALAALEAAYALVPVPTTGVALAQAQEANGKLVEARDTALAAASMATEGNEAFERAAIEARELANRLAPRVPAIRLRVTPENADVELDGKPVPAAVRVEPLRANPGPHRLRVSAPGFATAEQSFSIPEGGTSDVRVALAPGSGAAIAADSAPASASSTPAWVYWTGGASLVLAGVAVGTRIDEASVEAKIRDKCHGDVLHGCPPRSVYDPAADDRHKHVDFDVFLGASIAAGAALTAATIGFFVSRAHAAAPATTGRVRVEPFYAPGRGPGLALRGVL